MLKLNPVWLVLPLCLFLVGPTSIAVGTLTVTQLKCEYRAGHVVLDNPRPRLSWVLNSDRRGDVQTAWQVLVAGNADALREDTGDLWDSGKVESADQLHVLYRGKPLASGQACYWKVRAWDADGRPSSWSEPASWEMGLLAPEDWAGARWLNDGKPTPTREEDFYLEDPAPLFRREFSIDKPVARARLYVTGIGYYEASLNGGRVGDLALDPAWTRYSERVFYSTHDVTAELRPGDNCLGVTLGNGWYNPLPMRMWGRRVLREHMPVGRPRFITRLAIEFTDGTRQDVLSDNDWMVGEGPILFNNIYLGEIYDARREQPGWDTAGFDDAAWGRPAVATEPIGPLRAQPLPPIRCTATLEPVGLSEPQPGVFIFDMGQNFAGWVRLSLEAPAGTSVTLRFGELLNPDGTLNPLTSVCGQIKGRRKNKEGVEANIGGPGSPLVAWQADTYIARGGGIEHYTPRFTFHAFRYVEVTGLPGKPPIDSIEGLRLNSDIERVGSFACSNELFNRIQTMCDWTFLSNIFAVQSDCPHRERFGYGGDIATTSEAFMMNYDMAAFYAKAVRDWHDSVLEDGTFTDTAPNMGTQYCGVAWAMVHPLLLRQLWQYYGDRQLLEEQYATARRWLEGVNARYPDFIVTEGLSDHEGLAPMPAPEMVTPLYAASARLLGELAAILGHAADAERYARLAEDIRAAYLARFFDPATGKAGPATQASQSFMLYLNLAPTESRPAVLDVLLEDLRRRDGHLSTGIFGTKYMLDALSREGHAGAAGAIVNQRTFPGWGHMLDLGATTLWEHWKFSDNTYSHNHPMFGSVSEWFYRWLGGIQPDPAAVGFDRIIIRPQMVSGLEWVRCAYDSARGRIVSNWQLAGGRLRMEVEIPVGATALVHVPAASPAQVREGGHPAAQAPGVELVTQEAGAVIYRVGAGRYLFHVDRIEMHQAIGFSGQAWRG